LTVITAAVSAASASSAVSAPCWIDAGGGLDRRNASALVLINVRRTGPAVQGALILVTVMPTSCGASAVRWEECAWRCSHPRSDPRAALADPPRDAAGGDLPSLAILGLFNERF
jgi:hypothetical protein